MMRLPLRFGLICLLAAATAGCDPSPPVAPTPTVPAADFGRFEGDIVAVWDANGRNMTLREDFAYLDPQGRRWPAPAGSVVDGASIPRLFWTLIGGPFEGKYRNASVVHDVGCVEMRQTWEDVHRMFFEACRCAGVEESQAKIMYYAVYHFGPRWQPVVETIVQQVPDATGQVVERQVTVEHAVRIDPPPPTPDELAQVQEYIQEDKPEPLAIERFNRASLHRRPRQSRPQSPPHSPTGKAAIRDQREAAAKPDFAVGAPARQPPSPSSASDQPQARPLPRSVRAPSAASLEQAEQDWAIEIVRQHLEQQADMPRPAEYRVERARDGYLVLVQFLHEDEQGQMVPYEGGTCSVRLSREGQVREVVSGIL
jgi:hypothetical protein